MINKTVSSEAAAVINRMMDALTSGLAAVGLPGASARSAIGDLKANASTLIAQGTIGTAIADCFTEAIRGGATIDNLDGVRMAMLAEDPAYLLSEVMKLTGIILSFSFQCQIISTTTFTSRNDVDTLMVRMTDIIDTLHLEVADLVDGVEYQLFIALAAALIQHLAATELTLPRIVKYKMPVNFPALNLANRLYADATRSDELIRENQVVHPAFFPLEVMALSA